MGVTAIKTLTNKTNELIEFSKREDQNDSVSILPNSSINEDVWIPWVTNLDEFNRKAIEIRYTGSNKIVYVWQNGDKVRYSTTGWENPGKAIPGDSQVDGDRTLFIENGYPVLKA